jgi:hypothetical protein
MDANGKFTQVPFGIVQFRKKKIIDDAISELNIPTGEPLVYEFDNDGKQIKHYYLSSDEEIKAKIESLK